MKNDYYVYLHHLEDGTVFYVGKGRGNRAYIKSNRNRKWTDITKSNNYTVSFYKTDLDEPSALKYEKELIRSLPNLVNSHLSGERKVSSFSREDYECYFRIDPNSPSNLYRTNGVWNGVYFVGEIGPCGHKSRIDSKNSTAYWKIVFKGKLTSIHHIVWILHGNTLDVNLVIDHIDGNGLNNDIKNLRQISRPENCRNNRMYKNNKTGINGISFREDRYVARVSNDLIKHHRSFSITKHGSQELALKAAQEWRAERIAELNEHGAGYTERHGT